MPSGDRGENAAMAGPEAAAGGPSLDWGEGETTMVVTVDRAPNQILGLHIDPEVHSAEGGLGAVVVSLEDDSVAAKAGIVPGDIIVSINGNAIRKMANSDVLTMFGPDQMHFELEVTKSDPSIRGIVIEIPADEKMGMELCGYSDDEEFGAQVVTAFPGLPAAKAGLNRGDILMTVNGAAVHEMPFADILDLLQSSSRLEVEVQKGHVGGELAFFRTVELPCADLGVEFESDGPQRVRVKEVTPGSAADQTSRVCVGDYVIKINDVDFSQDSERDILEVLDEAVKSSDAVLITLSSGLDAEDDESSAEAMEEKRTCQIKRGKNGFGFAVKSDDFSQGVRVHEVTAGGPADVGGLVVGDVLFTINGASVLEMEHGDVVEALAHADDLIEVQVQYKAFERIVELHCPRGVGFTFGTRPGNLLPQIIELIPGMPAAESGAVALGDFILSANGIDMKGKSHEEQKEILRLERLQLHLESGDDPIHQVARLNSRDTVIIDKPREGIIGLRITSDHFGDKFGMMVTHIEEGTAASKCENIEVGDVIRAINGYSIDSSTHDEVIGMLRRAAPGPLTLSVDRFKTRHQVVLVRPDNGPLGIILQFSNDGKNPRIRDFVPNTPAAEAQDQSKLKAGMQVLMINEKDMANFTHDQTLALLSVGKQFTLVVQEDMSPIPLHGSEALLQAKSITLTLEKKDGEALGLQFLSDRDVHGHVVTQVVPGSVGDAAKMEAGMVITKINGIDVTQKETTHSDVVQMFKGAAEKIDITVGHLQNIPRAVSVTIPRLPDGLGIAVASIVHMEKNAGVVISKISPGGNASSTEAAEGMRVVMANGEVLLNSDHHSALQALMAGDPECAHLTLIPTKHSVLAIVGGHDAIEVVRTVTLPRDGNADFGLVFSTERNGGGAFVRAVTPGSVADRVGKVFPGDRIITIDGKKCNDMRHEDIFEHLKLQSEVVLTLRQDEDLAIEMAIRGATTQPNELPPRVPATTVREVINGVVRLDGRGIGIDISTEENAKGVRISAIDPAGAVAADGIFHVGDHITQIDHINVATAAHDDILAELKKKTEAETNFVMVASREVITPMRRLKVVMRRDTLEQDFGMKIVEYVQDENADSMGGTYIWIIQPGSPAYFAGEIQPGDRIVEINKQSADISHAEIYDAIKRSGLTLELVAERPITAKPLKGIRRTLSVDSPGTHAPLGLSFTRRNELCTRGAHHFFGVVHVEMGSEAARAGFHEGDMILQIGDHVIRADDTHATIERLLSHVGSLAVMVEGAHADARVENDIRRELIMRRDPQRGYGIKFVHFENFPRVAGVIPNTPAALYGRAIKVGDNLVSLNGESTDGMDVETFTKLLAAEQIVCIFDNNPAAFPELLRHHDASIGFPTHCIEMTRSNHQGFGFEIATFGNDNVTAVRDIQPMSPADLSKLKSGDVIVTINKRVVLHLPHDVVLKMIQRLDYLEMMVISMKEFEDFNVALLMRPEMAPLGLEFSTVCTPDGHFRHRVSKILPNSPAAECETIRYGDSIRSVGGVPVSDMTHESLVTALGSTEEIVLVVKPDASDLPSDATKVGEVAGRWTKESRFKHDFKTLDKFKRSTLTVYKERGVLGVRIDTMSPKNEKANPSVKRHDVVLEVNGTLVVGWTAEEVQDMLVKSPKRRAQLVVAPDAEFGELLLNRRKEIIVAGPHQEMGLGIESKEDDRGARVNKVHPGSAVVSSNAAIRRGDDIIMVNGARTFGLNLEEIEELFSRDPTQCEVIVQDNLLPLDQVDDLISGTTRTVLLDEREGGLGLSILGDRAPFRVQEIKAGSAADVSNSVFVRDVIVQVNGDDVEALTRQELISKIKAQNPVELTFETCEESLPAHADGHDGDRTRTLCLKKVGTYLGLALSNNKVVNVVKDSAAAQSGLSKGDCILAVDGVDVSEEDKVDDLIRASGQEVQLTVTASEGEHEVPDRTVVLDKGGLHSFGIVLRSGESRHFVKSMKPGLAAAASGSVFEGDEVVQVNGVPAEGLSHQDVSAMIGKSSRVIFVLRAERYARRGLERNFHDGSEA